MSPRTISWRPSGKGDGRKLGGHMQLLDTQVAPVWHALPHPLRFIGSLLVSMHSVPHIMLGGWHDTTGASGRAASAGDVLASASESPPPHAAKARAHEIAMPERSAGR